MCQRHVREEQQQKIKHKKQQQTIRQIKNKTKRIRWGMADWERTERKHKGKTTENSRQNQDSKAVRKLVTELQATTYNFFLLNAPLSHSYLAGGISVLYRTPHTAHRRNFSASHRACPAPAGWASQPLLGLPCGCHASAHPTLPSLDPQ